MVLNLINQTLSDITYSTTGVTVPASSSAIIPAASVYAASLDALILLDIRTGAMKVSDGTNTLSYENAVNYLRSVASLSVRDSDGASIVRTKAAKAGWTYCSLPFEFETARLSDTLFSQDSAGNNRTFITMKAYDANNVEVTTPGLLNANYGSIVKTVIDFEPPYDFEIIGGILRTLTTINTDIRLWIVAVPDIPAPTGSKEMGGGINLRYLAPGNEFAVDGRVTKFAAYNAIYHTNKIRMIFKYPAGTNESLQTVVELYKS